jgi:hypothetical protein
MRFWDASAIIPLCIEEPHSKKARKIVGSDEEIIVWWGTILECHSAVARLRRGASLTEIEEDQMKNILFLLSKSWSEIESGRDVRDIAGQLLLRHPLRAADSLQLSAALVWAGKNPMGCKFVCLDQRLREAGRKEGFTIVPTELKEK